jgi:endonuclease-3
MQLAFGDDPRTQQLRDIHERLIACFGRIVRPPEKRREPVWVLVQGVIGARTKTIRSNTSTDRLLAQHGSWDEVADAPLEALVAELELVTFPELMAERLKACLSAIRQQRGRVDLSQLEAMDTADAMAWLETLPGVARKISAGVVNASTLKRKAMVLDSHHRRVLQRIGLVPARADTTRAYDVLTPVLPPEWQAADYDEHHLLMKQVGQRFCRPSQCHCGPCPLQAVCRTGQARSSSAR